MTLTEATTDTGRAKRIDAAIDRAIAERRIVGGVFLVAENGKTAYRRAAGLFDREAGTPMRADAIFRLASVSKPIVAATALSLIETGDLALDAPLTRWLPTFRPRLADGSTPDITIRHLLTHTAGLSYRFTQPPDGPYHRANVSDGMDDPGLPLEENLRRIASVPLNFIPGSAWEYSVSIDVLGAVIAQATGGTLGEAVAERVTGPLGMADTGFTVTDVDRLAVPYADGTPEPERMRELHEVPREPIGALRFAPRRIFDQSSFQSGGGGMVGTAGDLLKLLEAVRTGGAPILKTPTVAEASSNQIGTLAREAEDAGWRFGFLSAVLDDPVEAKTPETKGTLRWGGAYGHTWFIDKAKGRSVVAFTNTAIEGVSGTFPNEIRDAIYGIA